MLKKVTIDLSTPASRRPIPRSSLKELLLQVCAKLYPDQGRNCSKPLRVRYNAYKATVKKLDSFLTATNRIEVTIDEQLIREFEAYSAKTGTPVSYLHNLRNQSRKLINLMPPEYMQRHLVPLADVNRANRFSTYTKATQQAFEDFRKNGRLLKDKSTHLNPVLSNELLADLFRKGIIDRTLRFMRVIQANDIFSLTEDDVAEFIDSYEDRKGVAYRLLDFIRPLFSNLRAKGLIQNNILADIPRREWSSNLDYVDQNEIDKLADLTTLDMDNFKDVRGRLLAFGLDYDYALRNRESSLIKCSDFVGIELHLPKEIQKIKKDTMPIYSYFTKITGVLLKRYLELRAMKSPETDILMVSCDGRPLGADGCRYAVKDHCEKLGMKTHGGKNVVPHRLRHSFGTLNIEPLGLSLGLPEVMEQYRHANIQTTYDLYIAKNPLRKKQGYEKRMQKINAANGVQPPPAVNSQPSVSTQGSLQDVLIDENTAMHLVRSLGLYFESLRKYALSKGKAQKDGNTYRYSTLFLSDLACNYYTRSEAMDLLKMKPTTFFYWAKRNAVDFILIGQVSLFRKDVIMNKRRSG